MEAERTTGNDLFKKGKYQDALASYDRAIQLAENTPSESVPPLLRAIHSNRSACFHKLERYEEALEAATKCTEVDNNWAKGHFRVGAALLGLKRYNESIQSLKRAAELDPESSQEPKDYIIAATTAQLHHDGAAAFAAGDYKQAKAHYSRASLLHPTDPHAREMLTECLSRYYYAPRTAEMPVHVKYASYTGGKGLFLKQDLPTPFSKSSLVFSEKPFLVAPFPQNRRLVHSCDNCMSFLRYSLFNKFPLVPGLPQYLFQQKELSHIECAECNGSVSYCSEECQREAHTSHHSVLCHHNDPAQRDLLREMDDIIDDMAASSSKKNSSVLIGSTLTGNPLITVRLIATLYSAFLRAKSTNDFTEYDDKYLEPLGRLACPDFGSTKGQFPETLPKLLDVLQKIFPDPEFHERELNHDRFCQRFAQLSCNAQTVIVDPVPSPDKKNGIPMHDFMDVVRELPGGPSKSQFIDQFIVAGKSMSPQPEMCWGPFGSAIFSLQSVLNHSCEPNVQVRFVRGNSTLELVATRDIQPGEELCISYIDVRSPVKRRQQELQTLYGFRCNCRRCVAENAASSAGQPGAPSPSSALKAPVKRK